MRLLTAPLLLFLVTAVHAAEPLLQQGKANDGGILIQWKITQNADALATIAVETRDAASGSPIDYGSGSIVGFMLQKPAALIEQRETCAARVKTLATQGVGQKSDIDLNQYRIITLNREGSVAFINPFVGINNAKLEAIIDTQGEPADWAIDHARMMAWVLLKHPAKLLGVDLQSKKVVKSIDLPAAAKTEHLSFDAASGKIWLAAPSMEKAVLIATGDLDPHIAVMDKPGIVDIVATRGTGPAYWLDNNNSLGLLSETSQAATVNVGAPLAFIGHSESAASDIALTQDGNLFEIRSDARGLSLHGQPLSLRRPIDDGLLLEQGRWLAILGESKLTILDLATRHQIQSLDVVQGARELVSTDRFLYATGSTTGRMTMFAVDDFKHGQAVGIEVLAQSPRGVETEASVPARTSAKSATVSPEGNGIFIASARDGMIFQYMEGMMAPSGSLSNYRRAALGLEIIDYSLRRMTTGTYQTSFRPETSGRYELLLGGDKPRFSVCENISLGGSGAAAPAVRIGADLVARSNADHPGETLTVRLREITSDGTIHVLENLDDVELLVFDTRSGWQRRFPMRGDAKGHYVASYDLPRNTTYHYLVASARANLSFVEGQLGSWRAGPSP
jgi:hypothetical protein